MADGLVFSSFIKLSLACLCEFFLIFYALFIYFNSVFIILFCF